MKTNLFLSLILISMVSSVVASDNQKGKKRAQEVASSGSMSKLSKVTTRAQAAAEKKAQVEATNFLLSGRGGRTYRALSTQSVQRCKIAALMLPRAPGQYGPNISPHSEKKIEKRAERQAALAAAPLLIMPDFN